LLYPEGIDHDVLLVEGGDGAREVVGNETRKFDLQTGESLVHDRNECIVRSIMNFIIKVVIQGFQVGEVWRPVSLGFFQVIMSIL